MTAAVSAQQFSLVIAPATEAQLPFVLDSWARSYQPFMPDYARTYGMGKWGWTQWCAERLVHMSPVLVAALEDVPDVALGWACGEPGLVHWCYVKQPARGHGIASELMAMLCRGHERTGGRMTHRPGKHLRAQAHALGWRYEPLTREDFDDVPSEAECNVE